jgi:hypothetical protein
MSATYWWYGMTVDIKRVISGCKVCQLVKASGGNEQRDMQTQSPDEFGMFHRWGVDHAVELPTSANGNKHALVCVDYHSKWIEVIPVKDLSAETTLQAFLLNVIARYGTPAEIISDNGTAFKGEFKISAAVVLSIKGSSQGMFPEAMVSQSERFKPSRMRFKSLLRRSTMRSTGTPTVLRPSLLDTA